MIKGHASSHLICCTKRVVLELTSQAYELIYHRETPCRPYTSTFHQQKGKWLEKIQLFLYLWSGVVVTYFLEVQRHSKSRHFSLLKLITEPPCFWWSLGGKLLVTLFPQELSEIILCICTNRESLPDCENQVFLEIWVIQLWILGFQSDLYVWWLEFRNSIGNSNPIFGKECWIVGT